MTEAGNEHDLEAIAVELISDHVARIFDELDARQLVEAAGLELSDAEKAEVAQLIDEASIEMEIGFGDDDDDDDEDDEDDEEEHDHDHHHDHGHDHGHQH